jgi:hypothetical protein
MNSQEQAVLHHARRPPLADATLPLLNGMLHVFQEQKKA